MTKAILQDDTLSDAEKKRRIEEIDAMTKAKIASTQVAAEHELESFETAESGFDEDAAAQMSALEEVLRQAQMGYTRHMVAERALLQDTSNQVVGLLNNLMSLMEQEGMAAGGELTHEQEQQKIALEKLMLSVKATGQEMSSYAAEALQLAATAQQRAQSEGTLTESELHGLETKIEGMQQSLEVKGSGLKAQLMAEKEARKQALQGQRGTMMHQTKSVMEQLEYVCTVLLHAAEKSFHKQRELQHKVNDLKRLMRAHLGENEQAERDLLGKDRERQKALEGEILRVDSWEDKYMREYAEEQKAMRDHLHETESTGNASMADAANRVRATEADALQEVGSATAHMETDASKRAQGFGSTGSEIVGNMESFVSRLEQRAGTTTQENENQMSQFTNKAESWASNLGDQDNRTMQAATGLVNQMSKSDHELDRAKSQADKSVSADSWAELEARRSGRPDQVRLSKRLDEEERDVRSVEEQN